METKDIKTLWVKTCQICNAILTGHTKIEDGIIYYEVCLAV